MANFVLKVFAMSLVPAFGFPCDICQGYTPKSNDTIAWFDYEVEDGMNYTCGMWFYYEPGCALLDGWNFYRCCEGMPAPMEHEVLSDPACDWSDKEAGVHCHYGDVLAPDWSNVFIDENGNQYFGLPAGSQWMCDANNVTSLSYTCGGLEVWVRYWAGMDIADYESRCCTRGMTCGEVKTEYKSQSCCRNPDKPFMMRRLSAVQNVPAVSQRTLSEDQKSLANPIPPELLENFVREGLAKARARGGAAAVRKLKEEILELVKEHV